MESHRLPARMKPPRYIERALSLEGRYYYRSNTAGISTLKKKGKGKKSCTSPWHILQQKQPNLWFWAIDRSGMRDQNMMIPKQKNCWPWQFIQKQTKTSSNIAVEWEEVWEIRNSGGFFAHGRAGRGYELPLLGATFFVPSPRKRPPLLIDEWNGVWNGWG